MYEEIARELMAEGFTVTPSGCRKKYSYLLNRYREVKDHNKQSGKCLPKLVTTKRVTDTIKSKVSNNMSFKTPLTVRNENSLVILLRYSLFIS